MDSSIYSDLKKFAGEIKGQKISSVEEKIINEVDSRKIGEILTQQQQHLPVANTPELTIDDVAKMIKLPMIALHDAKGVIHDTGAIVINCPKLHIHKYFIKDIVDADGCIKCITCSGGNKFTNLVRETSENSLGIPFIISSNKKTETNEIEYVNPVEKITLVCKRMSGMDAHTILEDMLVINIHSTTSVRKIKNSLYEHLAAVIGNFTPDLQIKILAMKPTPAKKYASKIFQKEPLPFTQEMAKTHTTQSKVNPIAAAMCMRGDEIDNLCIENC